MSFTLSGHGMGSCPAKGRGVHLSTLISTAGRHASKHSVCEGRIWEPLIAKHLVIGRESSCEHGVQASADTLLHSLLHSLLCTIWGDHPPACKGHEVYWRRFARSHVPTQAGVDAGHEDVRSQNLVKIAVMRQVSQVSGQRLKLIED
jgi:hypothetical protein